MVCWWCTKKCRLFFSFLSSSSALFSTLEDWRPKLLVELYPDHIPELHWLYFVCPIPIISQKKYPMISPLYPCQPHQILQFLKQKTELRRSPDVLAHLWQCLNVVLGWAMVNTQYMVDGHPIHNKDPYNGYYKSLWTIGWLAPINGY